MAIRQKIEKVINKGGEVKSDKEDKEWHIFTLRIRKDMLGEIDKALEQLVGISKTGFILQAIHEKLGKLDY